MKKRKIYREWGRKWVRETEIIDVHFTGNGEWIFLEHFLMTEGLNWVLFAT